MIHTIQFYLNLSKKDICFLEDYHEDSFINLLSCVEHTFEGVTLNLVPFNTTHTYNLYLIVDLISFLGKKDGVITENDLIPTLHQITSLEQYLLASLDLKFTLIRLDYRVDIYLSDSSYREAIFDLWQKLARKYYHLKKCTCSKSKPEVDLERIKQSTPFKTSLYFNSKSLVVIAYDKEAERISKKIPPKNFEKGILRFEIRLNNSHLNNMKHNKKRPKELTAYFNYNTYLEYINKYLIRIFGRGDYYKIYQAKKLINFSSFTLKKQEKLIHFLKDISCNTLENSLSYQDNCTTPKYSRYTFKTYSNDLASLGINPILIPQNHATLPSHLPNPLAQFYN